MVQKKHQVGIAYIKGAYMYVGGANLRQNLLDAGRKTSAEVNHFVADALPTQKTSTTARRKLVGVMWNNNDGKRALFEGEDPAKLGATRWVFFG